MPEVMPGSRIRRTDWLLMLLGRIVKPSRTKSNQGNYMERVSLTSIELELPYAQAAKEHQVAFESSRRRFEYDILQAEIARWELEHARDELFSRLLNEAQDVFKKSQKIRLTVYREMEAKHDEVSRHNEEKRENMFTHAMTRRESEFRNAHEERMTRGIRYADNRVQLFGEGRKRREDVYEAVFRLAREMLGQVLRDAEESFFHARDTRAKEFNRKLEQQRASQAAKVIETYDDISEIPQRSSPILSGSTKLEVQADEGTPPLGQGQITMITPAPAPVRVHFPSPTPPQPRLIIGPPFIIQPDSSFHSHSQSRSRPPSSMEVLHPSRHCRPEWVDRDDEASTENEPFIPLLPPRVNIMDYPEEHPNPIPPPTVVLPTPIIVPPFPTTIHPAPSSVRPSSSHSPGHESGQTSEKGGSLRIDQHEVNQLKSENTKQERNWLMDFVKSQDALFMEAEQARGFQHSRDLEQWERSFLSAEEQRNGRTTERKARFHELQQELENIFTSTQNRFTQQFERKEKARTILEEMRVDDFNTAQEKFQAVFDSAQAWYRAEYTAASQSENEYMRLHEQRIRHLILELNRALEALRTSLAEDFTEEIGAYKRQSNLIYPIPPPCPVMIHSPALYSPAYHQSRRRPRSPHYQHPGARPEAPSRSSRSRRSYSLEPTPEAGFVPHTLFHSNRVTALPIPRDHIHNSKPSHKDKQLTGSLNGNRFSYRDHLARHRLAYERAAAQREVDFQSLQRRNQEVFAVGEKERQLEFMKSQKAMQDSAAVLERKQAKDFLELIHSQERSFEEGERRRADVFSSGERERERDFRQSQKTRDEEFHKIQSLLLKEAHEDEVKRETELITWHVDVEREVKEKRREWKGRFNEDEQKRRTEFERLLGGLHAERADPWSNSANTNDRIPASLSKMIPDSNRRHTTGSWFPLLLGRAKRSGSTSPKPNRVRLSPRDLESLFSKAIRERQEAFESSQRRYEYEFLQAEVARWKHEYARDELFDKFLDEVRETFMKCQETRSALCGEVEKKHDEVHRQNEEKRMGMFVQAMARRDSEFRDAHERRMKEEPYADRRVQLFDKGRKQREEVYGAVFRLAYETFEKVTQVAEEAFYEARDIRGKKFKKLEQERAFQVFENLETAHDNSESVAPQRTSPAFTGISELEVPVDELMNPQGQTPITATVTSGRPPSSCSLPIIPPPPLVIQPPMAHLDPHFHSRSSTPSPPVGLMDVAQSVQSFTSMPGTAGWDKDRARVDQDDVKQMDPKRLKQERSWVIEFMKFQDALFMEAEQERQFSHTRNLAHWSNSFRLGEEQRDGRVAHRRTLFEEQEHELDEKIFLPTQHLFKAHFERKEEMRNTPEETRLDKFRAMQEYYREVFVRAQAMYRAQYDAASLSEKAYMTHHVQRIQHLVAEMTKGLGVLRSYLKDNFTNEMRTYGEKLGFKMPTRQPPRILLVTSPLSEETPSEPEASSMPTPPPAHNPIQYPGYYCPPVYGPDVNSYSPPDHVTHLPPSRRIPRRRYQMPEPEAGFIPQTLLQRNAITKLPIPQDHIEDVSQPIIPDVTPLSHTDQLARHKHIYERAAAQRDVDFESLQRRQQEEFAVGDTRRQLEFLKCQKSMQDSATARERKQAQTFLNLIHSEEHSFEKGEKQRADVFSSGEGEREQEFRKLQKTQADEFYELQLKLFSEAHEEELKREKELISWRVGIEREIREGRREWEARFYDDEQKRRDKFEQLLGGSYM
ncbi:hypothetical protein K474DRAFT_1712486 [Panus rudis PR-1116 ss-1]|nr:hypothetical protein K474DRAFT_1712486 [Panus rudis PR-1116 ss-1]